MLDLDEKTWNLVGGMVLIALLIGLVGLGAKWLNYYRRQILEEEPLTTAELLEQFQKSLAEGEIDKAEFLRIQESLTKEKRLTANQPIEAKGLDDLAQERETSSQSNGIEEKDA